jgi:hypothetical protein
MRSDRDLRMIDQSQQVTDGENTKDDACNA